MAVVKNLTGDTLSLFSPDAPPIDPGGEVTVSDETFANLAWPTSTWELVTPPEGFVDESHDEAHLFVPEPEEPEVLPDASWTVNDLKAWAADHGIDLGSATTKAEIVAAILAAIGEGEN